MLRWVLHSREDRNNQKKLRFPGLEAQSVLILGFYWGYTGIMEKEMDTTTIYWVIVISTSMFLLVLLIPECESLQSLRSIIRQHSML